MRFAVVGLLAALVLLPASAAAQDSALVAALRQHRHVLRLDEAGRLQGPGAELLLQAGRQSQFFMIGEEHGVAQVPMLATALFRELAPVGYRHLAIETGPWLASGLDEAARQGTGGIEAFVNRWWPGAPFYSLREEADLLSAAVAAAGGGAEVLWGLDYDILADRYTLNRLRDLAPTPAATAATERVMAAADSMLAGALAAQNLAGVFMFAAPEPLLAELRAAYAPQPGSEADEILRLMEATLSINRMFMTGGNYESNQTRANLLKQSFVRRWRQAAAGGTAPRVMLKFGANHLQRGRTPVGTYDLGTLLPELAEMDGGSAFGLLAIGGRDRQKAVIDGRNFSYTAGPSDYAQAAWMEPVFSLVEPEGWTLFDLRPLRTMVNARRAGHRAAAAGVEDLRLRRAAGDRRQPTLHLHDRPAPRALSTVSPESPKAVHAETRRKKERTRSPILRALSRFLRVLRVMLFWPAARDQRSRRGTRAMPPFAVPGPTGVR